MGEITPRQTNSNSSIRDYLPLVPDSSSQPSVFGNITVQTVFFFFKKHHFFSWRLRRLQSIFDENSLKKTFTQSTQQEMVTVINGSNGL